MEVLEGVWCSAGCKKCFEVSGCWSVFGVVSKCKCFDSDAGSNRRPVEGVQRWGD